MLTAHLFQTASDTLITGGPEILDRWREERSTTLWVDVDGPLDEGTSRLLGKCLELHPLALQDAGRDRHPPKVERFEDHTLLIYKGLAADSDGIDCRTIQIAVFVGARFLVTRHSDVSPSIARLGKEMERDHALFANGPSAMAVRLSRFIVDRYLKVLLDFEPRLEILERDFMGESGEEILGELVAHKSDIIRLQRIFHYHVQVTRQGERA